MAFHPFNFAVSDTLIRTYFDKLEHLHPDGDFKEWLLGSFHI